jgi:cytochrome c oxidase subunit 3
MGIKAYEYYEKYVDGLVPIRGFAFNAGQLTPHSQTGENSEYARVSENSDEAAPGAGSNSEAIDEGKAKIFYGLYFAMTGVHFLHMVIGIAILLLFLRPAARGSFTGGNFVPVELMGLYWHFVDIVWIFLFPLLYLIDRSHS